MVSYPDRRRQLRARPRRPLDSLSIECGRLVGGTGDVSLPTGRLGAGDGDDVGVDSTVESEGSEELLQGGVEDDIEVEWSARPLSR